PARYDGPRGRQADPERSPLYLHLNTGKRSVTLDLESETGIARFRDMAARADVLLESFEPAFLERAAITYDALRAANPRLVHLSLTPYGHTGPMSGYASTDITLFASTGAMYRE